MNTSAIYTARVQVRTPPPGLATPKRIASSTACDESMQLNHWTQKISTLTKVT
jgi:hypothetical protein